MYPPAPPRFVVVPREQNVSSRRKSDARRLDQASGINTTNEQVNELIDEIRSEVAQREAVSAENTSLRGTVNHLQDELDRSKGELAQVRDSFERLQQLVEERQARG